MPKNKKDVTFKKHLFDSRFNRIKLGLLVLAVSILSFVIIVNFTGSNYNPEKFTFKKFYEEHEDQFEIIIPMLSKPEYHVSMNVLDEGYNIYAPVSGSAGYRYGPSLLINDDGSLDAWFSTPGNNGSEWDWITYRHSDDGVNWSKEKIVLQPTADSMDHYSICDPGVIYFDGYYYLGYTSTIVATDNGINNNIFVARSTSPDGPYEKWNGEGWGGDPEPIIYYNESDDQWGAGEISFVIVDDVLYCYYSWHCEHGTYTKVSTAPLSENWPSELQYQGICYRYKNGQDSCDVVYLEEYEKFVSFAICSRFTDGSGVIIYESNDGIDFKKSDMIFTNVAMYAHNMGISKRKDGHLKDDDTKYISYAYSNRANSTGKWATRFQEVELIVYESRKKESYDKDGSPSLYSDCSTKSAKTFITGIGLEPRLIKLEVGDAKTITPLAYNQYHGRSQISDVEYEYDENIIKINNNKITALDEGEVEVKMYYGEFYTTFKVIVGDINNSSEIVKVEPVEDHITLYLKNENYHSVQIRAYVEFENGKWGEAYNDFTFNHPKYPSNINAEYYELIYEVEDEDICTVSNTGIVEPRKKGKTKVHVYLEDYEFEVDIEVKNQ